MGLIRFILNGTEITSPPEFSTMMVNASFKEGIQPNLSIDELTLGFEACTLVKTWLSTNGYFRGMPLIIEKDNINIFDGYLDFKTKYIEIHNGKILVAIKMNKGLNQLNDFIEGYSFGLLATKTALQTINIPYVVEKKNNALETALVSLTTLFLIKELRESIARISSSLKDVTVAATNTPFAIGLFIGAAIQLVINLAYTFAMLIALKNLISDLLAALISPVRFHKSFNIQSHLNSFFLTIGYNGFQTGITDLNSIYYFPSKEEDSKSLGIPNSKDYGYTMSEFIKLMRDTFNANLVVDSNNIVHLRSKNDTWFVKNSSYVMPDVLLESSEFNTEQNIGTRSISFKTDVNDEWTIENFKGTAYDIFTSSISNVGTDLISGLDETRIQTALASRKDGLNTLEKLLRNLGSLADKVINALGGSSNLAGKVTARVGMIKVTQDNWEVPKMLLLDQQFKLNSNHRGLWSAKELYNKYHNYNSFVLNNNGYQKKVFNGIEIPFCSSDYLEIINNSYFTTNTNKIGKFTNVKMGLDSGKATADFWVSEVYDTNLKENYVEP